MPRPDRSKRKKQQELSSAAAKCSKLSTFFSQRPDVGHLVPPISEPSSSLKESTHQAPPPPPESEGRSKTKRNKKCKVETVASWKSEWDWIEYEEKDGYVTLVWCKVCRAHYSHEAGGKGTLKPGQAQLCDLEAYIKGTDNVKKDTVQSHNGTKLHKDAAVKVTKTPPAVPLIYKQLSQMDIQTFNRMCKLFDWAYTVAYSEFAFTDFEILTTVEKKHGVDLGNTYGNDKACKTFIEEIGGTMSDDLQQLFKAEPFYCALLFDGSTDKSMSEKEVVSVKLLENGIPKIKLLGITEPERGNAEGIHDAVTQKCEAMQLDIKTSCIAVAADGASVNFGQNTGVLTRLQATMPWLIKMHCVAHRMELALKDAFKGSFYEVEIDNLMLQLYYMYRRSEKKWKELKRAGEAFDEHIIKPSRSQGTRWVDHRRKAIAALTRDYRSLVSQFEEMGSELRKDIPAADRAKMRGYVKLMTSHHFVLYLASYQDLVEDLAELSLALQNETIPISSVRANIEVAQASLISMRNTPGRNLRRVLIETEEANGVILHKSVTLKSNLQAVESFKKKSKEVIEKIISCISSRFSSFTEDPVLAAADILDPSNYPTEGEALAVFGIEQITTLIDHFRDLLVAKGCDVDAVEREWTRLKYDISRNHKKEEFYPLWKKILTEKEQRYRNVLHLVRILLVCPVGTAHVERQFSYIKRFLGDWRLNLGRHTIEHLLRICTEGPKPSDFQPERAVNRWRSSSVRTRRPHIQPYGRRKTTTEISDHDSSDDD